MEPKKISFGFSKIKAKPNLLPNTEQTIKQENKVELIKCLEGQEIKLIEEKEEIAPLVIPLKENQKTANALASLIRRRAVLLGEELPESTAEEVQSSNAGDDCGDTNNLEQRAARELLAETQTNNTIVENSNLVLPVVKPDELPLDGAKEATIEDYDNIPIKDFGMAMLRGMGWVEPPKKKNGPLTDETIFVRPKGMGLGADKALKPKPLLVKPEANEVLEIKKQAYVRILGGKHKDAYGQIEGFDDHAGRVIVKMAIGGAKEAFNEFLCQPISRKEYTEYGKCINTAKYEAFKKLENENGQIEMKPEVRKKEEVDRTHNRRDEDYKHRDSRERYFKNEEKHLSKGKNEQSIKEEKLRNADEYKHEEALKYSTKESRNHETGTSRHRSDDKPSSTRSGEPKRRSRSRERRDYSNNRRRQKDATTSTDDTSESSDSDDSAYERKSKKKSSSKKSKQKSRKTKHSKSRRSRRSSSSSNTSTSCSRDSSVEKRHKSHKKKTKKSKKQRSRSYTRSRSRGRR